ncbi:MAG: hypothetical protein HPKKFMNG_02049 [Planctomycetes bacterium]|nr:hypothetical protein [Planctomycetota bacterium]
MAILRLEIEMDENCLLSGELRDQFGDAILRFDRETGKFEEVAMWDENEETPLHRFVSSHSREERHTLIKGWKFVSQTIGLALSHNL